MMIYLLYENIKHRFNFNNKIFNFLKKLEFIKLMMKIHKFNQELFITSILIIKKIDTINLDSKTFRINPIYVRIRGYVSI